MTPQLESMLVYSWDAGGVYHWRVIHSHVYVFIQFEQFEQVYIWECITLIGLLGFFFTTHLMNKTDVQRSIVKY